MYSINFNFDPVTEKIQNLKVTKIDETEDVAIIQLIDNKLKLSKGVFTKLGISTSDRIVINYYTVSPEETFPIIGTPAMFQLDNDSGNRITKSRTVSYRGQQKDILLQYGNSFKMEPFKDYFKLIPFSPVAENDDLKEEENDLENININL